jgi:hypothetical protein
MATKTQAYINAIRFYLTDSPETNLLLGEEESSDMRIALAMQQTIEDFYAFDPRKYTYTVTNFPSAALLINGSVIHLLRMAGILHSRNEIPYQAGGVSIQLWSKAKAYLTWVQHMQQEYFQMRATLIKQINIAAAMNGAPLGVHSDYFIAGFDIPGLMS